MAPDPGLRLEADAVADHASCAHAWRPCISVATELTLLSCPTNAYCLDFTAHVEVWHGHSSLA